MGSRTKAYCIALLQTRAQSLGIQEHTEAMIPLLEEQALMEIEMKKQAFEQDVEQLEALYLLAKRFEDQGQEPTFVTTKAPAVKSPNYMLYIGLAILAWYFWKGR